jgi:hypothetical protein
MWALAQSADARDAAQLMLEPIAGELAPGGDGARVAADEHGARERPGDDAGR